MWQVLPSDAHISFPFVQRDLTKSVSASEVKGLQSEHWICTLRPWSLGNVTTLNLGLLTRGAQVHLPLRTVVRRKLQWPDTEETHSTFPGVQQPLGQFV